MSAKQIEIGHFLKKQSEMPADEPKPFQTYFVIPWWLPEPGEIRENFVWEGWNLILVVELFQQAKHFPAS